MGQGHIDRTFTNFKVLKEAAVKSQIQKVKIRVTDEMISNFMNR